MPPQKESIKTRERHGKPQVKGNSQCLQAPHLSQSPCNVNEVPLELFQLVLNVFQKAYSFPFDSYLHDRIQAVKQHLYNRDFDNAFGREDYRMAYAVRWSPSRALAYINILHNLPVLYNALMPNPSKPMIDPEYQQLMTASTLERQEKANCTSHIVCIGAGAGAEVVALGMYLESRKRIASNEQTRFEDALGFEDDAGRSRSDIKIIDIADWETIIRKLHSGIAEAAKQSSAYESVFQLEFLKEDVLRIELPGLNSTFTEARIVTMTFTLNELYCSSMKRTTSLLLSLTTTLRPGTLLLVIDSPGSYSTVQIGSISNMNNEKRYPMQWLLDHTLLESANIGRDGGRNTAQWEKLEGRGSEWFRLPKGLSYPIDLQDMRYQLHLYRRL